MSELYPVKRRDRRSLRIRSLLPMVLATLVVASCALLVLIADGSLLQAFAEPAPARATVMTAWRQVRDVGAYQFSADIEQEVIPLATAGNVGRSSKTQRLYIEGDTDLAAQTLQLALWSQGGSVLDANSAAEVKVAGDKAFTRQGDGDWQETDNFTGGFAPEGDFLTFLQAATNIQAAGVQTGDANGMTRYTFDIDGPSYARYLRDTMQQELAARGVLPHGITLDLPAQYVDMTGSGELWLAASGLPVRQVIHLDLPAAADADYRTKANISVAFTYRDAPGALLAANPSPLGIQLRPGALRSLVATVAAGLPQVVGQLLLVLAVLALTRLLARKNAARQLYMSISLSVILIMLATPILQAAEWQRFGAYVKSQTPAQDQSTRKINDVIAAYNEDQEANHRQPAESLAILANDNGADRDADGLSDSRELLLGTNPLVADPRETEGLPPLAAAPDDGTDSDGDGLTDTQETLLGTLLYEADSDGDALTDYQEVIGFTFGGQRWYGDPQKASTLDDTVLDGQKCLTFPTCPDSDGDGTPNIADRDIDNDGVPNNTDLSPFKAGSQTFGRGTPMNLTINGLTPNAPTYVEFQLRPTNPDRLWYAFNVLNWPAGDHRGQVLRDVRGVNDAQTFFDVCVQNAVAQGNDPNTVCSMSPDDNGDIKFVPMLEIQTAYYNNNLPSDADLQQFGGISVRRLSASSYSPKAVYVPLNLVVEPNTEDRVAFYGKMLYKPGTNWGTAQQVRLVWVVQMLVDVCAEYDGGLCVSYDTHNAIQPVHTYYDDWKLTALNVREDRGTDFAVVYEDPTAPNLPAPDTVLVPLSVDLDGVFLAARDCDTFVNGTCYGDGLPDLTVTGRGVNAPTIAQRLDRLQNGGVSATARWGLPNVLRVVNKSYGHRDEAFGKLATIDTPALLNSVFTSFWSTGNPISPSLLFAREERFRAMNLTQQGAGQAVTWSGSTLTLDFRADGGVPAQTIAGVNMARYQYDNTSGAWRSMAIEEAWAAWDQYYAGAEPGEDVNVAAGKLAILEMYLMALLRGLLRPVAYGDTAVSDPSRFTSDQDLLTQTMFAQGVGKLANLLIVNQLVLTYYVSPRELQTYFGILKNTDSATKTLDDIGTVNVLETLKRKLGQITNGQGFGPRFVGVGVAITLVAGITGLTLFAVGAATDNNPLKLAGAVFLGFALAVATIAGPLLAVKNFVFEIAAASQISRGAALVNVLGTSSEVIGMTKTAAIVGLVISVGIPWGIFMYQALSGGVKVGTMAFNAALATAIASTIVTLIMFALSLTVVGFILTAVLGFVDLLNTLLCEAGVSGACFSLVGSVTAALASLIYSSGVTINFDHKDSNGDGDLVRLGSLGMRLQTPDNGFVHGNSVSYYAPVKTTLYQKRSGGGAIGYYDSYFNESSLRSSTFSYWLQGDNFSAPTVARNDMSSLWQNVYQFDSKYYGFPVYNRIRFHTGDATQTVTSPYFPLTKGLNQRIPLNLYMRYAVAGYECWTAYCKTKTLSGDSKTALGDNLYFDVFPSTLDEFYTLAWSSSFGTQLDHDGDGLLSRTASSGGLDPNDTRYDTDSDKLPDGMEVRLGTSNSAADTDGDGLGDYLEAILGTDATRTDTDRDGLTDAVEVNGWLFTYATGLSTLVTTDPRLRDTDSDGLSDSAEFNLGTNPRAKTESPVGIDLSISDQDRVIRWNSSLVYTATVSNNTLPGAYDPNANLTLSGTQRNFYPGVFGGGNEPWSILLSRGARVTRTRTLTAQGSGAALAFISTNAAGSILAVYPSSTTNIGAFDESKSLDVTIDGNNPTSSLTTQFVPAGRTVLIGGQASDPTSYVARVEVRIDGGAWQVASPVGVTPRGNAAYPWALEWSVPNSEGAHTVSTRATDAVGNVQSPITTVTLYVDAQTPTVTANVPANNIPARRNDDNRWSVTLAGTATDPGSGAAVSGVETVQVSLSPDGTGWQRARHRRRRQRDTQRKLCGRSATPG